MSADVTKRCQRDTDLLSRLPLMPLENNDETKYVLGVPPVLEAGDECNVVTLGVGNDTMSEVALSQMIPSSCRFYGADPVVEGNEQLYSRIGTFFPYAVAATTGFRMASVLGESYCGCLMYSLDQHAFGNDDCH
ncbi:unnamed protein product [Toxocara canis]|uniref:Methyltransf_25 domain-containing protein n=1 Tax=Toxocara canis TaxID=6265 RepID=A0A183VAC2_TOXCA|nr:unnamed protein product [Toxocara canis]